MTRAVVFLISAAGLAVGSSAATTLQMLVSTDGLHFSNSVGLEPNTGKRLVEVLTTVSHTGPPAIGLASLQFQPIVSNWAASDAIAGFTAPFGNNTTTPSGAVADAPGQYGRLSPWASNTLTSSSRLFGHVHLASGGIDQPPSGTYLRVAQAQLTSWFGGNRNTTGGSGVPIRQFSQIGRTATDPAFNPSLTDVRIFRFAVIIDTDLPARTLSVTVPMEGIGNRNSTTGERQIYWYAGAQEPTGSVRETPTLLGAEIVVPGPAGGALLGLGAGVLGRRRRLRPIST